MAGQGLYGTNQGNETRAAGRHQADVVASEAAEMREIDYREILLTWTGLWQCNATTALERDVNRIREQWLAEFWDGGDLDKEQYRRRVETNIQGLLAQATFGDPGKGSRRRSPSRANPTCRDLTPAHNGT